MANGAQMLNYKEFLSDAGQRFIVATDENGIEKYIPLNESNSDYQAYLKSLEDE